MSSEYWDKVADRKSFRHPFNHELFTSIAAPHSRVLDVGCGYGRILGELNSLGYRNTLGIDSSEGMIARATRENPTLDFKRVEGADTGEPSESVDAVVLFAVLTSIPDDSRQEQLVRECWRVLRAGGIIYVSDYCLNDDARNLERYSRGEQEFGVHGVFRLDDGGVMRHHSKARIESLFANFEMLHYEDFSVATMNGNASNAFQLVGRKPWNN